jgi:hypothetical protein
MARLSKHEMAWNHVKGPVSSLGETSNKTGMTLEELPWEITPASKAAQGEWTVLLVRQIIPKSVSSNSVRIWSTHLEPRGTFATPEET